MSITVKIERSASSDLRGEAAKPHSFQSAAHELPSSSGGPAGSSARRRSEEPATLIQGMFEEAKRAHTLKRTPAIYGYSCFDVEFALNGITAAQDLFLSAVKGYLDSNEHVASFVDFEDFAAGLRDMVGDELRGPLMRRMDEMRGDR